MNEWLSATVTDIFFVVYWNQRVTVALSKLCYGQYLLWNRYLKSCVNDHTFGHQVVGSRAKRSWSRPTSTLRSTSRAWSMTSKKKQIYWLRPPRYTSIKFHKNNTSKISLFVGEEWEEFWTWIEIQLVRTSSELYYSILYIVYTPLIVMPKGLLL